ncbi:MAG: ABC transporter substrate-binding protein [Oscillospiraceae bacterium]|nr:ABC transporter substrate-binding protein [Oscillospiraceae bacterium]
MKKFKSVLALVLSLALIIALAAGCKTVDPNADPTPTPSADAPTPGSELTLIKAGTLTIGSEISYPPFEMYDDDGVTPIGLDIELAQEIAKLLGLKVEFVDTGFDGILAGIDAGKYDISMSSLTITPDRSEQVNFSTPYIENWQAIVVKKGSAPITSDLDMNGKKIAFQTGTTSEAYIDNLIATEGVNATLSSLDHVTNAFDELRLGRVDGVLCDSVVADGYVAREGDNFEISWIQSSVPDAEPELFGIAVGKTNASLLAAINDAVATLEANGTLERLRSDWLS